jgi:hypothetical protein
MKPGSQAFLVFITAGPFRQRWVVFDKFDNAVARRGVTKRLAAEDFAKTHPAVKAFTVLPPAPSLAVARERMAEHGYLGDSE